MSLRLAIGLLLCMAFTWGTAEATQALALNETVTNKSVLEMVNAKLPVDLIITKIETSHTDFDLSTEALVKLNRAGVPSEVIKAMMKKKASAGAPTVVVAAAIAGDSDDPASAHEPGIWAFISDGRKRKMVLLEPTVYTQNKTAGVLKSAMTYGIARSSRKPSYEAPTPALKSATPMSFSISILKRREPDSAITFLAEPARLTNSPC